ncbi:MAG: hypothetical protein LUB59_04525 [Candidatus Gastranaerophilales bacterium]|nr:hypothetical protein [Candidatus Gastranaerophilales bacterium]
MVSSVSINNQPADYNKYTTDRQRAKAEKFVNKDEYQVSRMANKQYNKKYQAGDKNFSRNVNRTINSLPLIAATSGLLMKKGVPASLRTGAYWGIALLSAKAVGAINDKAVKSSPKLKKAEKKNPGLTLLGGFAASLGAMYGANTLFDKAVDSPKAQKTAKNVVRGIKEKAKGIKNPFSETVKEISGKIAGLKSKIKVPDVIKNSAEKIANSHQAKAAAKTVKSVVQRAVKYAPTLVVLGSIGAVVGKTISSANKYSNIKSNIKEAQFNTAKDLMNIYSEENAVLKDDNNNKEFELNTIKSVLAEETADA